MDFRQRTTAFIVGSRLTVTLGVHQSTKPKQGILGRDLVRSFAKKLCHPQTSCNVALETCLRKAIYLERMGWTLNGFPFQRITFLFNVKLAYRCDTALTSSEPSTRFSRKRERKGVPLNLPPDFFSWPRKHCLTSRSRVDTRCTLLSYGLSCESLEVRSTYNDEMEEGEGHE